MNSYPTLPVSTRRRAIPAVCTPYRIPISVQSLLTAGFGRFCLSVLGSLIGTLCPI
jgi:hypothetical protein